MKCDHLVNFFTFHLKDRIISATVQPILETWCDDAERVSSAPPVKKFHFKYPRWRMADTLERPVLYYHAIC